VDKAPSALDAAIGPLDIALWRTVGHDKEARRIDPMRQASGQTSLENAVEETRALIRQLDDLLCEAAESARSIGTTHPKDQK
jgi:hypothetical protein